MSQSDNKNNKRVAPDRQFDELVFPGELKALASRSSAASRSSDDPLGLPDLQNMLEPDQSRSAFFEHTLELLGDKEQDKLWKQYAVDGPAQKHAGLTGLALSGGGIRSASVNLGIVQVLHRIGLFKCLDYMSTVSGGGYLGGSISTCYTSGPSEADEEEQQAAEPEDKLEKAVAEFPYSHEPGKSESAPFRQLRNYSKFLVPHGKIDYVKLPVLLLRGIIINFLVVLPWIIGLALVSHWLMDSDDAWIWTKSVPLLSGEPFAITLLLAGVFLGLALFFPVGRWLQHLIQRKSDLKDFRNPYERFMAYVLVAVLIAAGLELQPLLIRLIKNFEDLPIGEIAAALSGFGALLASAGHLLARNLTSILNRFGLYIVAFIGIAVFWILYLLFVIWLGQIPGPEWWPSPLGLSVEYAYLVLLGALFVYTNMFVDANGLSLHNFYRDRLSEAFIFRHDRASDSVDNSVDPKLTDLGKSGVGPLHLVTTTLNTKVFPENFRKGRQGEPFLLSPLYFGSRITGYSVTEDLEDEQPDVMLSTAIATSGAAVSSNMGTQTTAVLRLILSVLNIRLGYWLLNPMATASAGPGYEFRLGKLIRAGVFRFLQELTGALSFETSYIYLSDGGHIENLGLYELVRRQCRFIIAGDGECDTNYNFKGLTDALRMIRTDFGIVIEMDGLDEIRNGEQQFARGTIYYPDGRHGYLIYLKSSLLGDDMVQATVSDDAYVTSPLRSDDRRYDELGYMAHYKATHPDFPQETTADQFFDEVQFESYRALGYLIAKRALMQDV